MKALDYVVMGMVFLALFWAIRTVRQQQSGCSRSCNGDCGSCKKKGF